MVLLGDISFVQTPPVHLFHQSVFIFSVQVDLPFSPRPNFLVQCPCKLSVLSEGSPMSNHTQHTSTFFPQTMTKADRLIHERQDGSFLARRENRLAVRDCLFVWRFPENRDGKKCILGTNPLGPHPPSLPGFVYVKKLTCFFVIFKLF